MRRLILALLIILALLQGLTPFKFGQFHPFESINPAIIFVSICLLIAVKFFKAPPIKPKNVSIPFYQLGFLIILGGIIIRIPGIGMDLSHDEPLQISVIQGVLRTGKPVYPSGLLYPRGLTITYPTAALQKILPQIQIEYVARMTLLGYFVALQIFLLYQLPQIVERPTTLFTLGFISLHAYSIIHANFIRGYMPLAFFTTVACVSFYKAYFLHKPRWIAGYWLSIIGAVISHQVGLILLALGPIWLLSRNKYWKPTILFAAISAGVLFGIESLTKTGYGTISPNAKLALVGQHFSLFFLSYFPVLFPVYVVIVTSSLVLLSADKNVSKTIVTKLKDVFEKPSFMVLLSFFIMCTLSVFTISDIEPQSRYLFLLFPSFTIIVAFALSFVLKRLVPDRYLIPCGLALILLMHMQDIAWALTRQTGSMIPTYFSNGSGHYMYGDHKSPAQYVRQHLQAGDNVISLASNSTVHKFYLPEVSYWHAQYHVTDSQIKRNAAIMLDFTKFSEILRQSGTTWVITAYNTDPAAFQYHFTPAAAPPETVQFLQQHQDKVEYVGQDGISRVYRFTN